jgi:ankyrin repeat protein
MFVIICAIQFLHAASCGRKNEVLKLMDEGANIDSKNAVRVFLFKLLHGNLGIFEIKMLFFMLCFENSLRSSLCTVSGFASHACQTQAGYTALVYAAISGHTDCMRLLVEGGADKDAKTAVRDLAHLFTAYINRSRF